MKFAVCFTNFGPYHLARLRALATLLAESGDRLVAYEVAGREQRYPALPQSGIYGSAGRDKQGATL